MHGSRVSAKGSLAGVLALAAGVLLPSAASAVVFDDVIFVRERDSGSTNTDLGSFTDTFKDVVGSLSVFDTQRIRVVRTATSVTFDIFTQFDPAEAAVGELVEYADLAITLVPNNAVTGPFNSWTLGVDLQTGRLYQLPDGNADWKTSDQAFGRPAIGRPYGSRFRARDCDGVVGDDTAAGDCLFPDNSILQFQPVVRIDTDEGTDLGAVSIAFKNPALDPDGAGSTTQIEITIDGATFAASGIGENPFDIFWGTSVCANDGIWGTVTNGERVPEPAMLGLLGLGLAGVAVLRRRRR